MAVDWFWGVADQPTMKLPNPVKKCGPQFKLDVIKAIRCNIIKNNWNVTEAAAKLGCSKNTAYNIINNRTDRIKLETLLNCAESLNFKVILEVTPNANI